MAPFVCWSATPTGVWNWPAPEPALPNEGPWTRNDRSVWNVVSAPVVVPAAFAATTRKGREVVGERPGAVALVFCGPKLEPSSKGQGTLVGVLYPVAWKAASLTYWNWQVVSKPDGMIVAFTVAVVSVMFDADSLTTAGAPAVWNVLSAPFVVPAEFATTTRK